MANYKITDKQVDEVLVYLRSIDRTREQLEDLTGGGAAIRELEACTHGIYRVMNDARNAGPLGAPLDKLPL